MTAKSTWYNYVKYSTRPYVCTYRIRNERRWLVLTGTMEDGQTHEVWFKSWHHAAKDGWKRASK